VIVTAEIGMGEVLLALIPTLNLIVMAIVWKLTGKVKNELVGQTEDITEAVTDAKSQIQTDLKNGIRDRVDTVVNQVQSEVIPRLDNKQQRLEGIEQQLAELTDKVSEIE
jgi:hypothetical protein